MNTIIWPVILSGGAGTRLWPLSVPALPKQLLALTGARTMLQETALRTAGAGFHAPVIVCGTAHAVTIATQLGEVMVSRPRAVRVTKSIIYMAMEIMVGARIVTTSVGVFKIVRKPNQTVQSADGFS